MGDGMGIAILLKINGHADAAGNRFKLFIMLPLSYQGFGFTAILLMVLFLSAVEGIKWLRSRAGRSTAKTAEIKMPLKEQIRRDPVRK